MVPRREILRTSRLVLTTWLAEDLDDLHELHSDAETMRWVRHGRPETRPETEELLATYRTEQDGRGWTKWRLADAEHGTFVGRAGFGTTDGTRELGYTLTRARWGQGLATEIAAALVRWHRDAAPDVELCAYAALDNAASRRVLDKVGFISARLATHNGMACAEYQLR